MQPTCPPTFLAPVCMLLADRWDVSHADGKSSEILWHHPKQHLVMAAITMNLNGKVQQKNLPILRPYPTQSKLSQCKIPQKSSLFLTKSSQNISIIYGLELHLIIIFSLWENSPEFVCVHIKSAWWPSSLSWLQARQFHIERFQIHRNGNKEAYDILGSVRH